MKSSLTLFRFLLAGVLLAAAGCALSPQVVDIRPVLETPSVNTAKQPTTLALQVEDDRSNKVIGYRGGVYATATLTAAPDMTVRVYRELARIFTARGYSVRHQGPADISLTVKIASLGYQVTEKHLVRTIETSAVVRATSKVGGRTRTGEYRDRRTKQVVSVPSEAENQKLINDILSSVLQQLVSDPDLLKG
jgi:uncharacterized lipoprotein